MLNKEQELFTIYEQVKTLTEKYQFEQGKFQEVAARFEEKKRNPELSIMVYGVYNAGKSTFINALIGQEVAKTDDIPLTDKITAYPYQTYEILDTPGIDAPIEHEKVADEQLLKSDVVLFVVNPSGVIEEQATLNKLMDLFENDKKVFLIFNEKNQLSEEDFIKLKDQTRQMLQHMALERDLQKEILGDIPIYKVNAKRALTGKLKQKAGLVKASGINEVEYALNELINGTRGELHKLLKSNLLSFINFGIDKLSQPDSSELKRLYDKLAHDVLVKKAELRKNIRNNIKNSTQLLQQNIQSWIFAEVPNLEQKYQDWITQQIDHLAKEAQDCCEEIANQIQIDIDNLEIHIPKDTFTIPNASIDTSHIESGEINQIQFDASVSSDNVKNILFGTTQVLQLARPEHLVSVLKLTKSYLPSLMKGIGPATMGKMARTFLDRAAPMIAVTTAIYDIWNAQSERKKAEEANLQMQRAQQQAIERRNAQIKDTARQVANDFNINIDKGFVEMIDEFFEQFINYLGDGKRAFSKQEQENSTLLAKLTELKQRLL